MTKANWAAVGAISTLLAVIVALFKDEITKIWRKPKIAASLTLGPPDCHKTMAVYSFINPQTGRPSQTQADCYYFRIWVENIGNSSLRKAHVFASKLYVLEGTDYREVENFSPMNLRWSHTHEIYAERISPKMGRHCDVGHIADPKYKTINRETLEDVQEDETVLALDLEVLPNTKSHLLQPGQYRLAIKLAADNHEPVNKLLEFNIKGKWFSREVVMLYKGITMSLGDAS